MPDEKRRLDQLLAFIKLNTPQNDGELADVLGDFAAKLRGSTRGGGQRSATANEKSFEVAWPAPLLEREAKWTEAQLRREADLVDSVRWHLGFDDVPFPGDTDTADALGEWCIEILSPEPELVIQTVRKEPSEAVLKALKSLRPRTNIRAIEKSDEENQAIAFRSALRSLSQETDRFAERAGCERGEALRWILAGEPPRHAAIRDAKASSNADGPNMVTLSVNADLVTPEEIRTLYRQLRRIASPPDEELDFFLHSIFRAHGSWKERLTLWNETHPLRKYKNVASLKAASWRIKRREAPENR